VNLGKLAIDNLEGIGKLTVCHRKEDRYYVGNGWSWQANLLGSLGGEELFALLKFACISAIVLVGKTAGRRHGEVMRAVKRLAEIGSDLFLCCSNCVLGVIPNTEVFVFANPFCPGGQVDSDGQHVRLESG
jgi:hypothetical protein